MNNKLIVTILLLLKYGVGFGQNHTFFYDLRDGNGNFTVQSVLEHQTGFTVGVNKNNWAKMSTMSYAGQPIATYIKSNFFSINLSKDQGKYVSYMVNIIHDHADSISFVILDSMLQPIREFIPIKSNWPRPYFRTRSFVPVDLNGKIAYFGGFSDSSVGLFDSIPIYGWLVLNGDTLSNIDLNTNFSATRMMYCYPADTGFYSVDPTGIVVYPWSPSVSVASISKFDNQMNWQKTANFAMPSNLPGYTRLLQSNGTINLAINQHSVYAMSEYEAASPNFLSITQKSCAVYRFDRELNRIRVVQDTAATGKVAETSARQQIAFDKSGKYIYAVWKECDPYQFFADQTRECATVVLKYDTALNLVWKRVFGMADMNFHAETMAPTPDGGLLVAGFYIDLPPGPNIRNTFVLKVDSAGNHVVSAPYLPAIEASVNVYPNPTSDALHLRWQNGHFSQLHIRDVQGRMMGQWAIEPQHNETQINVHHWAPGLYFYQLRSPNGKQLQGKFLKR